MDSSLFMQERDQHYGIVTLAAPAHESLRDGLRRVHESAELRALLIVANADVLARPALPLQMRGDEPPQLGTLLARDYNPLIRELRALDIPVVCALGGAAVGFPASLALACDVVVATHNASLSFAVGELTPMPGGGITYWLPRLVGPARAMGMLLLRDKITADEAEKKGLIWKAIPEDRLLDEGRALARYFAAQPTRALAAIKRALRVSLCNSLEGQLELESALHRELAHTEDFAEAHAAVLEKRHPQYRGR